MSDVQKDFTTGSISKKLIAFMIPILGSLILQAMYGAVDLLVVGRFGTKAGLSGVSTGSGVINLATYVIIGLAMGVTVLIGRYIGQKEQKRLSELIGGAIWFFVVAAVILTVVLVIFARPLAILLQAPKEAVSYTVQYIRICGGGIVFIVAYNVIGSVFRGMGDSKSPLIFVTIACIVNVIGDLVFVAVLGMDTAGAALATVLAQAVSVIASIIMIRKKELPFTVKREKIRPNNEMKKFFMIGLPIALQDLLTQSSFLALCAFVNRLGLDASSGYGVANKLVAFFLLIPGAIMQSMAAFVSQNVGAGREDRAKKSMLTSMIFGVIIGSIVFISIFLFGDIMCGIFTKDDAVVKNAWDYLKGFASETVLTAFLFSFIGYFNGHEQTLFVMIQGLSQTLAVRLPMSYFMSIRENATLREIGYAFPSATLFGIIINVIYFAIYVKKHTVVHREEEFV
ncbi:MAG: MATE family efflux transporter [Lachnospiraceae bacterium]|nr:MATE family efflux transporter [Lachnospiraceae bacterium]